MSGQPDPKRHRRIKDPGLFKRLHAQGGTCALADDPVYDCRSSLNLHHVLPRSQGGDDVEANLVWLCGSGTTGHHGFVEYRDRDRLLSLRAVLLTRRPDTISYLADRLGGAVAASTWLQRYL